jgi:two-component system response regulator HydG
MAAAFTILDRHRCRLAKYLQHLPASLQGDNAGEPQAPLLASGRSLKAVEEEMILKTLEDMGGNRTRTAEIMGISRRTLQLKLKAYGVN